MKMAYISLDNGERIGAEATMLDRDGDHLIVMNGDSLVAFARMDKIVKAQLTEKRCDDAS